MSENQRRRANRLSTDTSSNEGDQQYSNQRAGAASLSSGKSMSSNSNGATGSDSLLFSWTSSVWYVGLMCALSYALNYFWRYPIFVLPSSYLGEAVATVFGRTLTLQQTCSMAMMFGFGLAKGPALVVMTSSSFFRHRLGALIALYTLSMLLETASVSLFLSSAPLLVVLGVFCSSFLGSWVYGGVVTYLEGRTKTDGLLAITTFSLIAAGNVSRGAGSMVLKFGISPHLMPLFLGTAALVPAIITLVLASRVPGPTKEDIAVKSKRSSMKLSDGFGFLWRWIFPVGNMLIGYSILTAMRQYRDLYSAQLFSGAINGSGSKPVDPSVFFTVDVPGGIVTSAVMFGFSQVKDNEKALRLMLLFMIGFVSLVAASTWAFHQGFLGGYLWQVLVGIGLYGSFTLIGPPCLERLMGLTQTAGTLAFVIFFFDGCGYAGTISLFLYQMFGPAAKPAAGATTVVEDVGSSSVSTFSSFVYLGATVVVLNCVLCLQFFSRQQFAKVSVVEGSS